MGMEEKQSEVREGHNEPADSVAHGLGQRKKTGWGWGAPLMECLEVIINFSWRPGIEKTI